MWYIFAYGHIYAWGYKRLLTMVAEKAMEPHSSALAWKIPWTEKPSRLQFMGSHRVGHIWSDLAVAAAYNWQLSSIHPYVQIKLASSFSYVCVCYAYTVLHLKCAVFNEWNIIWRFSAPWWIGTIQLQNYP